MTWALIAIATVGTVVTGLALPATTLGTWALIAVICFTGAALTDARRHYADARLYHSHRWPAPKARRNWYIDNSQS